VIKLSCRRSVGLCVGWSVGLSSALWKNSGSDPDAVWHHRSDGSRDEAGNGVWDRSTGRGTVEGEFGVRHCNQWGHYGVRVRQCRDAALFPNYITLGRLVIDVVRPIRSVEFVPARKCFDYCTDVSPMKDNCSKEHC